MTSELLYTVGEVAQKLKTSRQTVYRLVSGRQLGHHRLGLGRGGGKIVVSQGDLDLFLASRHHDAGGGEKKEVATSSSSPPRQKEPPQVFKHLDL